MPQPDNRMGGMPQEMIPPGAMGMEPPGGGMGMGGGELPPELIMALLSGAGGGMGM